MRLNFRACMRAFMLTVLSSLFLPASVCAGQTKPGEIIVDVPFGVSYWRQTRLAEPLVNFVPTVHQIAARERVQSE